MVPDVKKKSSAAEKNAQRERTGFKRYTLIYSSKIHPVCGRKYENSCQSGWIYVRHFGRLYYRERQGVV
jgi:hypothetical protein